MPSTVQPFLVTRDLDRLTVFYRELLGAEVTQRVPADGPTFFLGLRIGDSDLGLVAEPSAPEAPPRVLLSIDVAEVDALLPRVEACGGRVNGARGRPAVGAARRARRDPDGNPVNLTQQPEEPQSAQRGAGRPLR